MRAAQDETIGYLCADDFLRDAVGARALASAFELGLVDALLERERGAAALAERTKLDESGLGLLLGMLEAGNVLARAAGEVKLTASFMQALRYRDLLEAKLDFIGLAAPDFVELFSMLLADPRGFTGNARIFELFSYQRCFDPTPENFANTARWMRLTTALTKYEAPVCLARHDFSRYGRMLDVGGNSGEFALQACRRHAGLRATVHDLPLVCELGMRRLNAEPEAARIDFVKVGVPARDLPTGHDVVVFKSMLHDWPEQQMREFLARAHRALNPGGTLLIFERSRFEVGKTQVPYSTIPLMLFFRSYRPADGYRDALSAAGFHGIKSEAIELDMPFMLVTARK